MTKGREDLTLDKLDYTGMFYYKDDSQMEIKKDDVIVLQGLGMEFNIKVTDVKEGKTSIDKVIEFEKI
jgi:hypothetical protein